MLDARYNTSRAVAAESFFIFLTIQKHTQTMKLIEKIKALFGFAKKNPAQTRESLLALLAKIAAAAQALKALVNAAKDVRESAEKLHGKADEIIAAAEQATAEVGVAEGEG